MKLKLEIEKLKLEKNRNDRSLHGSSHGCIYCHYGICSWFNQECRLISGMYASPSDCRTFRNKPHVPQDCGYAIGFPD